MSGQVRAPIQQVRKSDMPMMSRMAGSSSASSLRQRSSVRRAFHLHCAAAFAVAALTTAAPETANAQEILLTGPLAGAPSVRKQRLYRDGRFEIAPTVSFTLLDEYERLIMVGARLNYNITDWLAVGVWGSFSPEFLKVTTSLSDEIQSVNGERRAASTALAQTLGPSSDEANLDAWERGTFDHRLTENNVGNDFTDQVGTLNWIVAPQITIVPFRGKIGIFESIYVDTDFHIFAGPALVSLTERETCASSGQDGEPSCSSAQALPGADPVYQVPGELTFATESRQEISVTFGLGFQFYFADWGALGVEWRALPVARNTGGFDIRGVNGEFPDLAITEDDRELKFNNMISVSLGISLPFATKVSE